jgi:hypothetical protein
MAPDSTPVAFHKMVCETQTADEALFVCTDEACGRTVVVGKFPPRLTVIDRGDLSAQHAGSTAGLTMGQVGVA